MAATRLSNKANQFSLETEVTNELLISNIRNERIILLSSKVNYIIFITLFTFTNMKNYVLDGRINVLTSGTRDTRL